MAKRRRKLRSNPAPRRGRGEPTSIAAGLGIGLGIAALLGVGLIILLLWKRRESSAPQLGLGDMDFDTSEPRRAFPLPTPPAPRSLFTMPTPSTGLSPSARAATVPVPSGRRGAPVGFGTEFPTRVTARVVGPVGSFATLSYSAGGDGYILGPGESQEFRLRPKQVLYGRGSVNGVLVTTIASESPIDNG